MCIQATGGASMSLNTVISSTGTTGERQRLRSSPSDACGTCSGTSEGATLPLPLHLPILILLPIPVPTLILVLILLPNPRLNPNPKSTPLPTLTTTGAGKKAAGQSPVSSLGLVSVYNIWSRNSGKLELTIIKHLNLLNKRLWSWLVVILNYYLCYIFMHKASLKVHFMMLIVTIALLPVGWIKSKSDLLLW